jgi:hypothetical protein
VRKRRAKMERMDFMVSIFCYEEKGCCNVARFETLK